MTHDHGDFQPRIEMAKLSREAYRAMVALDGTVRARLEPSLYELVKIRASQINGCAYCIDMHTLDARAAGETDQRMHLLHAWREAPFYTPRERAALALTEAVTLLSQTHVPDDVWARAAEHFDETELAHLVWAIGVINVWNRVAVSSRMVPGEYVAGTAGRL